MPTTTNVRPRDLNYSNYTANQYNRDIINAVPFYRQLHKKILSYLKCSFDKNSSPAILDLGAGTATTSKLIRGILPNAHFDLVDFSSSMLRGAKKEMGKINVRYIKGDYATMKFERQYDIVVTVIGFHHQSFRGMEYMIRKIYKTLKPGGIFIIGDLMTYINKQTAALNHALHFHHLVEHTADKKTLAEWAHHHLYLNKLTTLNQMEEWFNRCDFKTLVRWQRWNTALIVGKK